MSDSRCKYFKYCRKVVFVLPPDLPNGDHLKLNCCPCASFDIEEKPTFHFATRRRIYEVEKMGTETS